ncbi:hypothetical protein ETD83_25650 [Actinomadura soli]|uniref:Subtilisin inhibitor domain-containing protein n=1 Tax=Actinomadura soli TaxID=2508997 RepID=A0A5C4J799_9ACTN|nr:SSI family serine proteinase inhibitor [Actinomadura soli]TMQ93454.1 hypothetical protein ETD83_25650 [Actinomadura soli]
MLFAERCARCRGNRVFRDCGDHAGSGDRAGRPGPPDDSGNGHPDVRAWPHSDEESGKPRYATLTCDPIGGTHKNAKAACAELALAIGDISKVPPQRAFCLAVWIPVDAAATGSWKGVPIKPFSETITNDACASISYGHVFDF